MLHTCQETPGVVGTYSAILVLYLSVCFEMGPCLGSSDILSILWTTLILLSFYWCTNNGAELFEGETLGSRGKLNSSW